MLRSSSRTNTAVTGGAVRSTPKPTAASSGVDFEDRYRRTAEENLQLKKERNELEEKLKDLKTKFRRLTRDLVPDENGDYVLPSTNGGPTAGSGPFTSSSPTGGNTSQRMLNTSTTSQQQQQQTMVRSSSAAGGANRNALNASRVGGGGGGGGLNTHAKSMLSSSSNSFHQPSHVNNNIQALTANLWEQEKRRLEENLKRAKAQIDYMQSEMVRMQNANPADANASHLANQIQILHQQLDGCRTTKQSDEERVASLQRERDVLHTDLAAMTAQLKNSEQNRIFTQQQLTEALAALQNATNKTHASNTTATTTATHNPIAIELGAEYHKRQVTELMTQLQTMRDKQLEDQLSIDQITRERDAMKIQLGRAQAAAIGAGAPSSAPGLNGSTLLPNNATAVDSASLQELQRALSEKSAQILVLTNQMNFATSRAEAMKTESDRLIEDLKSIHQQHAEVKRNMFQLEHEKASLQLRCEKVATLEATVELKTQELMRSEHELLKCIDRLQSCSRETELQVRKELGDRMAELENMRDKAEADRRANEREVLAVRLEVNDLKRRLDNALHDAELYKRETIRLEAEKKEMMDRVAMASVSGIAGINNNASVGSINGVDLDDDVNRAVALATMRKRAAAGAQAVNHNGGGGSGLSALLGGPNSNATANEVMAMWEGMEWSDGKELSMLRETLAATAVDMELAETRCLQLQQSVGDKVALLDGVSKERDELLTENIELRHRISGVQTALARVQLQKISKAQSSHAEKTSLIIALNAISCDPVFQQRDDGSTYTPTVFFSLELEGLDYEPVLSETFYSLNANLSVQFVFENIDTTEINFAKLQKTNFVLQLHQSFGVESEIVAVATLNGGQLLHCRFDGVHNANLPMFSLEGEAMGSVDVTVTAPDLLIPMLLARPIINAVTPDSIRAALISFRAVRALRIQVFGANDLYVRNEGLTLPSPYVFYTSTSPHGITFIADTMVATSNRQVTANPIFDVIPTDHKVILDAEFIRFMSDGCLSFVVFDHKASDIQTNLGMAVVQLSEMLTSPAQVIQRKLPLHPQGTLDVGISWVRGPE